VRRGRGDELERDLARGAERAQAIAVPILAEVKDRVGLVPRLR
jgi:hypothetical protein